MPSSGDSGGSSTGTFTQPTDLSGCFIWMRSTSIGINSGSGVQYWRDDSGSGNHVYWQGYPANSSTVVLPIYNTNVINNFPVVTWSSTLALLATTGNNKSLNFSPGDVTTFSVYRTKSQVVQNIWSIDNAVGNANSSGNAFIISLNSNTLFPNVSGFGFNYGSGTAITSNIFTIYASSTPSNFFISPLNEFVVRNDRFRKDNTFIFGRDGADVASGQATTSYNIANTYALGGSNALTVRGFIGDVAEIIAYSPRLTEAQTKQVNTYLLQKYALPNVGSFTLYISSAQISNSGKFLYTHGKSAASGYTTLYLKNSQSATSGINLYTHGKSSAQTGFTLFVGNVTTNNKPTTLYIGSSVKALSGVSLYSSGTFSGKVSTTLYTQAQFQTVPWITLYEHGKLSNTGSIPLYISSASGNYQTTTLFTFARNSGTAGLPLYVYSQANPVITGVSTLYVNAVPSNVHGSLSNISLYLEGGRFSSSMPLYIGVDSVNTLPVESLPLYVSGPVNTGYINGSIELFTANYWQSMESTRVRLYTKGTGGLAGGLSSMGTLPLYIDVPFGGTVPFFVSGGGIKSTVLTLYSSGVNNRSVNTTMFVGGGSTTRNCTLYVNGPGSVSGEISMYVKGQPAVNGNITLYANGF